MAVYRTIADSEVDEYSPITESLIRALRDNPIAIAEGATGSPAITGAQAGLPFAQASSAALPKSDANNVAKLILAYEDGPIRLDCGSGQLSASHDQTYRQMVSNIAVAHNCRMAVMVNWYWKTTYDLGQVDHTAQLYLFAIQATAGSLAEFTETSITVSNTTGNKTKSGEMYYQFDAVAGRAYQLWWEVTTRNTFGSAVGTDGTDGTYVEVRNDSAWFTDAKNLWYIS